MNMYEELLKEWCDTLIHLQITGMHEKEFYGGIMCPSCARIHGRCADAIYPMMYLADKTGEKKYLDCAKRLFLWSENMFREDGSYDNDTNSNWRGITVFSTIQLGEALLYHGKLLDSSTLQKWTEHFCRSAEYLLEHIDEIGGNINYPVTCAHAMAVAHEYLGQDRFGSKGKELAERALHYFTEEGLLYGEGKPKDVRSPKGCLPVDLGYNVEESLPGLLAYAQIEKDEKVLLQVKAAIKTHLKFMLPDGAWDNSWGTRNNKWSYWGSRTSDGCQAGFGALAEEIPECGEAVYRNTCLLKACTHEGLLHGGPMYHFAKEPPCVHHTICHAKALAAMLEKGIAPEHREEISLPRQMQEGIEYFPSVHVNLLSKGGFRATVTDYDVEYSEEGHATGGAITMLWHEALGPLFAGTMNRYYLVEPNNMQLPRHLNMFCLTPRIECDVSTSLQQKSGHGKDGNMYSNINDKTASVVCEDSKDMITVRVKGVLRNGEQQGNETYELLYRIKEDEIQIQGMCSAEDGRFYFPIISEENENVEWKDSYTAVIQKKDAGLLVKSAQELCLFNGGRVFNPVGGFQAMPYYIMLEANKEFSVKLMIQIY